MAFHISGVEIIKTKKKKDPQTMTAASHSWETPHHGGGNPMPHASGQRSCTSLMACLASGPLPTEKRVHGPTAPTGPARTLRPVCHCAHSLDTARCRWTMHMLASRTGSVRPQYSCTKRKRAPSRVDKRRDVGHVPCCVAAVFAAATRTRTNALSDMLSF